MLDDSISCMLKENKSKIRSPHINTKVANNASVIIWISHYFLLYHYMATVNKTVIHNKVNKNFKTPLQF